MLTVLSLLHRFTSAGSQGRTRRLPRIPSDQHTPNSSSAIDISRCLKAQESCILNPVRQCDQGLERLRQQIALPMESTHRRNRRHQKGPKGLGSFRESQACRLCCGWHRSSRCYRTFWPSCITVCRNLESRREWRSTGTQCTRLNLVILLDI